MTVSLAGRARVATDGTGMPAGPPGRDGNTIISGAGTPPKSLGRNGDYFLDNQKWRLYGPRANGLWPITFQSLQGVRGDRGPGILHSNGPPSTAWGRIGDFYLDTDASVLYGPKVADGWPSAVTPLIRFISGAGAPSNSLGVNGQTYWDTTNNALYGPKAAGVWPAGKSLVVMITGTGSPSNALGLNGQVYMDTTNGVLYGPKTAGVWSPHPLRVTLLGSGTPADSLGVDGQVYYDYTNGIMWGPKASGTWVGTSKSLIGPTGPQGASGNGTGNVIGPGSGATVNLPAVYGNTSGTLLINRTAVQMRTDLGAADATTVALKANNLSDLASIATARTNLALQEATDAEVWAGTDTTKPVTSRRVLSSGVMQTVTAASNVFTPNLSAGFNFDLGTFAANSTLANPTGLATNVGKSGIIRITPNLFTITFGSAWKFPGGAPVASTTAGAVDTISYFVYNATTILCSYAKSYA